jgi:two-component system sensor histidine kinase VanS
VAIERFHRALRTEFRTDRVFTSLQAAIQMLTVENTGEKLTPQLVSTLAEPFQRGTERIRTGHTGVGLGLAIVKSITQAHDGTLTLTPGTLRALRHGATTRRATAHWQVTIRGIAAWPSA